MRRALLPTTTALALALVATATGCTSDDEAAGCAPSDIPSEAVANETLVVEGDPWSGYAPFRDPGLLEGTGYDHVYVEQLCQDVRAADLTAGEADIILTTLDQYLLQQPEGTVVGVIDQSQGADALALNSIQHPWLESLDDVARLVDEYEAEGDRPVLAYTGSSPSEMLLNELANTTDELRLDDFELVSVGQSAEAYEMLRNDEAQLAVIWEPDTSAAQDEGYTIALSSADVPNSIVDVIVASDALIGRDEAAVEAVVRSFYTEMDRYIADPEALEELFAEDGGLDRSAARSIVEGIRLYGTADAAAFLNDEVFPLDQPQVTQSIDDIGSILTLVHPDLELRSSVDGSYVNDLAGTRRPGP